MTQQVSGKRMLEKYEIEYNGQVFNCLECGASGSCSATSIPCQKCLCQSMYTVSDGSRSGSEPVKMPSRDCSTTKMTEAECNLYSFLNNKIIQNMSIVDCSNKMITAGANNQVNDVVMKSTCDTGPIKVTNVSTSEGAIGGIPLNNYTIGGIVAGVILLIVILIFLFR